MMQSKHTGRVARPASWTERMAAAVVIAGLIAAGAVIAMPSFAAAAAKEEAQGGGSKAGAGEKVNINTASAEQLQTLPGVGPALAQRILDYRKENGSFKKAEELMNVKGIGEKSYEKLKDHITVGS